MRLCPDSRCKLFEPQCNQIRIGTSNPFNGDADWQAFCKGPLYAGYWLEFPPVTSWQSNCKSQTPASCLAHTAMGTNGQGSTALTDPQGLGPLARARHEPAEGSLYTFLRFGEHLTAALPVGLCSGICPRFAGLLRATLTAVWTLSQPANGDKRIAWRP